MSVHDAHRTRETGIKVRLLDKKTYKWFYDNVHSVCYDALIAWLGLFAGGEKRTRRRLVSSIEFSPSERVLDMCCGTGGATETFVERAGGDVRFVGHDLSIGQLRRVKRRKALRRISLVNGDATLAPFPDGCFDKVLIPHAIHELIREDRLAVLSEARRILRGDGAVFVLELDDPPGLWVRLLVGLLCFYWLPFNFETPTRRDMLKHGLVNEVRESGFRVVTKQSLLRGVLQVVRGVK